MKYVIIYEEYSSPTTIPLAKEKRENYMKELAKHVTFPEAYQEDPDAWCVFVVERIPIRGDQLPPQFTKENQAKMEKYLQDEVDGTPQMDYDGFFAYAAGLGGLEEQWDELKGEPVEHYMEFYEQPEEIARMMKTVRDDVEFVEWVPIR